MSNEAPNLRAEDGSWDRAAVMEVVCERIAGGESVRQICEGSDLPDRKQINRWIASDEGLRKLYLEACHARTYFHAEEVIEIADTEPDPAVARVRMDARRWHCAKFNRVDFGEKVTQEHVGKDGGPIEQKTTVVDEREVKAIVDRVEAEY
ncbi:hypothetical protein [Cupriavidus gilardii]|uniref:terminase small subunit-like protein n=1 Tax=Cupriavidus gilardii TaxID=82541 RepID=UPI0015716565|nr:hypothetical protein [Cupriavidus gilardii]NSX05077.1 hypothetical protein [Cupriavidus gilardii]